MKVNKSFAPVAIILESQEEVDLVYEMCRTVTREFERCYKTPDQRNYTEFLFSKQDKLTSMATEIGRLLCR